MRGRVVLVMGRILDQDDGLGVYGRNLLGELMDLDPGTTYHVLLRTPRHRHLFDDRPNARSEVVPTRVKLWWDQVTAARAAARAGADLVFNPKFSLPLLSRRPGVMVLHGSDWYVNPGSYEWWDNLYIRIAMPLYGWKAAGLTAISGRIRDDLVRYAHVDADKVTVTYAAPSPHFRPDVPTERARVFAERHRLPERYAFAVARAYHTGHGRTPPYPGGNVEGLVRAYGRYRREGGTLPLVVAGRDIDAYLRARGFGERELAGVRFLGFVPHEEMAAAYARAELFVLTTLYESFSFPLVEALACGCPAIAPATGACPEVAGDAALLVDPRDDAALARALLELDRSPERRRALRDAGLERVKRFTWQRTAERTLEVFDALVPRPQAPVAPAAPAARG